MRKLLTLSGVILPLIGCIAQITIEKETHQFRPGDYLMKQQVEFIDLSTPGEAIIWNLKDIKEIDDRHKVSYMEYSDSLLLARELRILYKYQFKGDTLYSTGIENQTALVHYYKQPELYLIYPVNYGDNQEAFYYGTGNYCKQLDLILKGKSTYHADAWGTLLLPEGDSISNVLRIHHTKLQVEEQYPHYSFSIIDSVCSDRDIIHSLATDTLFSQTDTYRWYVPGYRYPVFETVQYQIFHYEKIVAESFTAFYYSPHEQYYDLEHDTENMAVREQIEMEKEKEKQKTRGQKNESTTALEERDTMEEFSYRLLMGKEAQSIAVNYALYQQAEVEILLTDIQGRILDRLPKHLHHNGSYEHTFSLPDYPAGEYLIRIIAQGKGYTEKIIK